MIIKELISNYSQKIPASEIRLFLCKILNLSIEKLLLLENFDLTDEQFAEFENMLQQRVNRMPVAYILGYKDFYNHRFLVTENVLIPRPETELIIDEAMKICVGKSNLSILDLCSGSGCVGISLAISLGANIVCSDISQDALNVIDQNVKRLNAENVDIIQSDYFENISVEQKFDIITCNPPYISRDEIELVADETLMFEPEIALFSEGSGLLPYKILSENAHKYLNDSGYLIVEIGKGQFEDVRNILSKNLEFISVAEDLAGIERCLVFRK